MGEAKIDLQKGNYVLGEAVSGTVRVSFDKPVSRRSATVYFVGKERTEVRYQAGKYRRTAVEESEFLHQEFPLPLPVDEKGKSKPGDYSIPFRFMLPGGLPVTYEGEHARIFYRVEAKIDVPLGFDIGDTLEFDVTSGPQPVQSRLINACSESWNNPRNAGISFTLERCQYRTGEELSGRCAFRNPDSKDLRKIDISLEWIETATAQGHDAMAEVAHEDVEVPIGGRLAKGERPFTIRIPEGAPATYNSTLSSVRCVLTSKLDIVLAGDVAANEIINIVGTVGDEKLLSTPYAYRRADIERATPEKAYRPGYELRAAVWCSYCGAAVKTPDAQYCPNCGSRLHTREKGTIPPAKQIEFKVKKRTSPRVQGIDHCITCGGELGQEDDVVWCPHCGKLAHREHLMEWVRSRGSCPACGKSLSEEYYE